VPPLGRLLVQGINPTMALLNWILAGFIPTVPRWIAAIIIGFPIRARRNKEVKYAP